MTLAGAGFDFGAADVQHMLCVLRGQATQFIGIIGQKADHVSKLVKKGGDPRGQGIAIKGPDAQCMAPNNARETAGCITLQNIRSFFEKGAIGVELDGGIVSGILLNSGGVGMHEEHFSRDRLEGKNVLGAVIESEIEGFECGGDIGISFAKPGAAGIFGGENGDDVFAGLLDGRTVRSCRLAVSGAVGKEIVTLEGLGTQGHPHPVQQAFIDEQAFQCGYCLNGWVMTTKALLDTNPHPSDAEIRGALERLVCRCGSHVGIFAAVRRAAESAKRSA